MRVCEDACVDMSRTTYVLGGKDVASMSEIARWLSDVAEGAGVLLQGSVWLWGSRPDVLVEDTQGYLLVLVWSNSEHCGLRYGQAPAGLHARAVARAGRQGATRGGPATGQPVPDSGGVM